MVKCKLTKNFAKSLERQLAVEWPSKTMLASDRPDTPIAAT